MIAYFDDFCLWVYVVVDDMCKELEGQLRAIASKFGRQNRPRRAPTRGAPTNCLHFFGQETGLQSPKTFRICDCAL